MTDNEPPFNTNISESFPKEEQPSSSDTVLDLPDEPLLDTVSVESSEPADQPAPASPDESTFSPPPPPPTPAEGQGELSPNSEERTWAMIAHLSILLNLFTAVLGPLVALIIYLVYQDKSRYVAYQSMQAFLFQLIWWIGGGVIVAVAWVITGLLSFLLIGLCLIPFTILISLIPLAALVYGVIAAIKTNQGDDFRYWLIGNWVRGTLTGK